MCSPIRLTRPGEANTLTLASSPPNLLINSFFNSASGEVKIASVENEGYALYEETEEQLVIFELFGNENLLLNAVFQNTEKEEIIYRQTANENSIPYGMFYKLNDAPEIENGFFGIPYST